MASVQMVGSSAEGEILPFGSSLSWFLFSWSFLDKPILCLISSSAECARRTWRIVLEGGVAIVDAGVVGVVGVDAGVVGVVGVVDDLMFATDGA